VDQGLNEAYSQIKGKISTGAATGYSAAGVVLEVGPEITDLRPGDRVACAGAQWAHHAEIIRVPRNLVAPIPRNLDFAGACTVTLGAIALQGLRRLQPTLGEAFVVIGLSLVLDDTPLPAAVRHGLLAGLAGLAALTVVLIVAQRRGMFAPMLRCAHRLGLPERAPAFTRRLQRLDEEIARFHGDTNSALLLSSASFCAGWALGAFEIYLILWFLGVPVSVHRALTIEVLSVTIDGMLFFVPAKAGTQEGGKVLIFTLLGLDPGKGLALGIVRRIRELTWALIGMLILSRRQLVSRGIGFQPVPD
jgi:hypothetical protein